MTWIAASDPLALLAIQAGQVNTPRNNEAARGASDLDAQQRYVAIGEPVPIVFARFRNSKGGILVSPGATEARFENDESNNVTAYYHLVVSEGDIDSIPVKDVFQRACRVGTHTQTYNRRAGTWTPANVLVQRYGKDLPKAPFYCGTIGSYLGMSTVSFNVTIPDGVDQYDRQVHLFIRGGMYVTRLYDNVFGPSDNFADLARWLLQNTARVPSGIIDTTALTAAATFLEVNSLTCNCWLRESTNYGDLIAKWAPYFLLCESNNNGKRGLRPLLPTTTAGAINTGSIQPDYLFTEALIIPGSIEIQYLSFADRQPFVAQMVWRQQIESGPGIIRTAEIRYEDTAAGGPYETHDLSEFCTSESHAAKVGAYILAKRYYTSHTIRFSVRPEAHNQILSPGDIIRVELQRVATNYADSTHNYLYQIERITKTLAGDVSYEGTHFPVDSQNRSLVALDVAAATGTGILLPDNRTGVTCDTNSSFDNTIPPEVFTELGYNTPDGLNPDLEWPGFDWPPFETPADPTNPSGVGPNELPPRTEGSPTGGSAPSDQLGSGGAAPALTGGTSAGGAAGNGDTLTANGMPPCPGLKLKWMATIATTGETTVLNEITGSNNYVMYDSALPPAWLRSSVPAGSIGIFAVGTCPNGESVSSGSIVYYTNRYTTGCIKTSSGDFAAFTLWPNGYYEASNPVGSIYIREIRNVRATPNGDLEWEYYGAGYDYQFAWRTAYSPGPRVGALGLITVLYPGAVCASS